MCISLESDLEQIVPRAKHLSLRFREKSGSQRLLGEFALHPRTIIPIDDYKGYCFTVSKCKNYCLPQAKLLAHYFHGACVRWRHPPDLHMSSKDIRAMPIFFICPRPVGLISAGGPTGNLFPVNLMGPLGGRNFAFALNSARRSMPLVKRARQFALSSVPLEQASVVRGMGGNHKRESIDWQDLPFGTFAANYSDDNGATNISQAFLMIQASAAGNGANQCILRYDPSTNSLFLLADAAGTYLGPIAAGSNDTLSNSQCTLTGDSFATLPGNNLTVNFSVIFSVSFIGTKQLFLFAQNNQGLTSAFSSLGTWTIPALPVDNTGQTGGAAPGPDTTLPLPVPTAPPAGSGTTTACNDFSGVWTAPIAGSVNGIPITGTQTLPISETAGAITSASFQVTYPGIVTVTWTVSSAAVAGNVATLRMTNPSPATLPDGTPWASQIVATLTSACLGGPLVETATFPAWTDQFLRRHNPSSQTLTSPAGRASAPGISLTTDIGHNVITAVLSGQKAATNLSITLNGSASSINLAQVNAGPGTYTYDFHVPQLPQDQYNSVTASWDNNSATAPASFKALSLTRFSQYNTPVESACGDGPATSVIVFDNDGECTYHVGSADTMNSRFVVQTNVNGSGYSTKFGLVKPFLQTWEGTHTCLKPDEPGATITGNIANVFVKVKAVDGSCISKFGAGQSLAVIPDPATDKSGTWDCSDQVLLVSQSNTIDSIKTVQDKCPLCSSQFGAPTWPGTVGHIDVYSNASFCKARDPQNHDYQMQPFYGIRLK